MNEKFESICFEIITNVGIAKGYYISAIRAMKVENDINRALSLMKKGDESIVVGHKAHAELLKLDAEGEVDNVPLLVMHSEDQLMSAETIKIFAEELIDLYQCLADKQDIARRQTENIEYKVVMGA